MVRSVSEAVACEEQAHVVRFEEMFNPNTTRKAPRKEGLRSTEISFSEKNAGLDDSAAAEAERCFHCGHCHKCGKCVEDCPGSHPRHGGERAGGQLCRRVLALRQLPHQLPGFGRFVCVSALHAGLNRRSGTPWRRDDLRSGNYLMKQGVSYDEEKGIS